MVLLRSASSGVCVNTACAALPMPLAAVSTTCAPLMVAAALPTILSVDCSKTMPVPALTAWLTASAPPAFKVMFWLVVVMPVVAVNKPPGSAATLPTLKARPLLNMAAPVLALMATSVDTTLAAPDKLTAAPRAPRLAAVMTPATACVMAAVDSSRTVPVPALMAWFTASTPPAFSVMSWLAVLTPVVATNALPSAATLPTLKPVLFLNLAVPVLALMATSADTALLGLVRSTAVPRAPSAAAMMTPAAACDTASADCKRTLPAPALMASLMANAPPEFKVMFWFAVVIPVVAVNSPGK